jgi:hypothetical protein
MHKRDARAFAFDLRAKFRELGDRLAAKGSAKMAQEHQEQRPILRKRMDGLAGLRPVRLQQLRIESFCLEHRCLHVYRFLRERQMLAASQVKSQKDALELTTGSRTDEYFLLPSSRSESTGIRSVNDEAGDNQA